MHRIKRLNIVQIAVFVLGLLTGCMARKTQPQANDLLGSWYTGVLQTEWGPSVLEITFHSSSDIEIKMVPTAGGQSIVSKGKYRLNGKQLISEVINKGELTSIWLEDNQLVIQTPPGLPQRFTHK